VNRPLRNYIVAIIGFSLMGLVFSAFSTYDFIAHLDRQVHSITCSIFPGIGKTDITGASGCHAVMMSPYSSFLRTHLWGGIPIALPGLAVFTYLLWRAVDVWLRREEEDPDETRYLAVATALPLLTSVVFFIIATTVIGALCQMCVGIYVASLGVSLSALLAHQRNKIHIDPDQGSELPWRMYAVYFAEGLAFVIVPILLYVVLAPSFSSAMTDCGELRVQRDDYKVRVKLHTSPHGIPALEVFDPLCPACKAFSQRLEASGLSDQLDLEAIMFPLDSACNWMVTDSLHPGACAVSEAILCADDRAKEVITWAFEHQEEVRTMASNDLDAVYSTLKRQFPFVANCVGRPGVKTRLNRSLRWAVTNAIPVLTPQLYVDGQKLCDEDTDLGLEYMLSRMLEDHSW